MEPEYTFQSQADLAGVAYSAMRQMILAQAHASGLKVLEDANHRLTVQTAHGLIGLRPGVETETAGMVAAVDERWLFVMKNAVIQQLQHVLPELAASMRWSDGDEPGTLPPNFAFVRVKEVAPLGRVFLRVTLQGEDLSSHADTSIHFRLVLPPPHGEVEWPSVAENGSIIWPDGPGAPHRPVYTTRYVDHAQNTIVTDVYIHDGGRTTKWAQDAMSGRRERNVVGVVGPSGGGLLDADHVLMATDETGFPAAARLLENLPKGAKGLVILEAEHGEACEYPIEVPEGIQVKWLSRAAGDNLSDETLAAIPKHAGAKVWFAGEREEAARVRQAAKSAGWEAGDLRVSGFWRWAMQ
ncbi:MAG: siderophore-interacting protein [Pseudomonadota bacterium]